MDTATDVYGCEDSMEAIELVAVERFSLSFEKRYSDYRGGNYLSASSGDMSIVIQPNYLPFLQEYREPDHTEYKVLLFLSGRRDELDECLQFLVFEKPKVVPFYRLHCDATRKLNMLPWNGTRFGPSL